MASHSARPAGSGAYWALVSVCFFWGTTYLGIRIALESFPPLALVALRFTASGAFLLVGAKAFGYAMPRGREWFRSGLHGFLTLGIGTGGLVLAETHIASSLAALFVAVGPFWMVGVEALLPGGEPLHKPTIFGMLVGLAGVLILVVPTVLSQGLSGPALLAFAILQVSCFGWALGSSLLKKHQSHAHPVVAGAVQQLGAGLAFALPALVASISGNAAPIHWDAKGLGAIGYLVVFGSIVGYSSYVYVLRHLPMGLVSIYNYVNPLVAALLGWLVYREHFGQRELVAMVVILTGVAIVKSVAPATPKRDKSPSSDYSSDPALLRPDEHQTEPPTLHRES